MKPRSFKFYLSKIKLSTFKFIRNRWQNPTRKRQMANFRVFPAHADLFKSKDKNGIARSGEHAIPFLLTALST